MSSFSSHVQSINSLQFHPIPCRPINVAKVVRTDNVTVFVDVRGNIYSTGVMSRVHYVIGSSLSQKHEDTFKCCVKLGLISKDDLKTHKEHAERESEIRQRKYAANAIVREAKTLGLKLTSAQKRLIKAAEA
jgi:hypothetical protein